jgi:hypothetical protein
VWAILSAQHGVVEPDEVIAPYDTPISARQPFGGPRLSPKEFDTWLYAHVQAWRSQYVPARLVVLAGRAYWQCLVERGLEVCTPLDGLGIGERLRWLKRQTATRPNGRPTLFREQGWGA